MRRIVSSSLMTRCCISSTESGRRSTAMAFLSWITAAAKYARITKSSSSRIQTSLGIPKKSMPFPIRNSRSAHCDRAEGGDDCYRSRSVCILEKGFDRWQVPDDFVFVEELSHTATGKLLKTKRRKDFGNWGVGIGANEGDLSYLSYDQHFPDVVSGEEELDGG